MTQCETCGNEYDKAFEITAAGDAGPIHNVGTEYRHSGMLLAGIQAEFGLDPRLKHSGVTVLGVRIPSPQPQFSEKSHEDHKALES